MHDSYARDYIILVIISVLIGLLAAIYDELLIHLLNFYRWIININPLYIPLLTTSGIFVAYITVLKIGKIKRTGSGAHDILHSYYTHNGYIHPRDTVSKAVASLFTMGLGGSAGPEGPAMLIGGGLSSYLSRLFKVSSAKLRRFSLAGASAGISAIFRAPFTGMLFALEIPFKRDIESEAFIEAVISSSISYLVFVSIVGPERIFKPEALYEAVTIPYLFHAILIGVLTSLIAIFFVLFYRFSKYLSIKICNYIYPHTILLPILGGIIISIFIYLDIYTAGPGYIIIKSLIKPGSSILIHMVIISILLKMVSTSITLTFGGSGGTFIPSLAVGALTGYLYSNLMGLQEVYIYIAVGMASMLAATNKTPLTAVAFVAETVGPGVIIPTLISSILSYLLTGYYSFYEIQYPRRMREEELVLSEIYHKLLRINPDILNRVKAIQIASLEPIVIDADMTVREALSVIGHLRFRMYPVIYKNRIVGSIALEDILGAPEEDLDKKVVLYVKDAVYVDRNSPLKEVIEKMLLTGLDHVFVVDEEWKLVGIISDVDVIRYLLDRLSALHREKGI